MALPEVPSGGGEFLKICSPSPNNLFFGGRGVQNLVVGPMEEVTCTEGLLVGSNMTWQPFVHQAEESRDNFNIQLL